MCQYCGCQAIPAIKELTDEHDRALDHIREAESAARALDAPAAQVAAAALVDLLAPHLAVEEQALFPALADEFPDHVRGLLADHEMIEQVLAPAPSRPHRRRHRNRRRHLSSSSASTTRSCRFDDLVAGPEHVEVGLCGTPYRGLDVPNQPGTSARAAPHRRGDLLIVPLAPHSLEATEDSAVLLTVAGQTGR